MKAALLKQRTSVKAGLAILFAAIFLGLIHVMARLYWLTTSLPGTCKVKFADTYTGYGTGKTCGLYDPKTFGDYSVEFLSHSWWETHVLGFLLLIVTTLFLACLYGIYCLAREISESIN